MEAMRISKEVFILRSIVPLAFFICAVTIPYLSLLSPLIVFREEVRIPFPERNEYSIVEGTDMLTNAVGLNISLLFLLFLSLLVLLQMFIPWHPYPIFDVGINLIISSAVMLVWYLHLASLATSIPIWGPIVISTIPFLCMVMVPINRIFIPHVEKRFF
jgi:hypothetical protein